MGSVVKCAADQVRFSFYLDDEKKGKEYGCALTVENYRDGIIRLVSEAENDGIKPYMALAAARTFLMNTSSVGTAKRILELGETDIVRAVRIDLKSTKKPTVSILVPKNVRTDFSIEA